MNTSKAAPLGQVLRTKPITLLVVPLVNFGLIVIFWQSQIAHYTISTEGVLIMWLVAGLVFGLIQLSLLVGAWQQAIRTSNRDIETLWLLGVQIVTFCVMTAYSVVVTNKLWQLGISPNQALDIAIMVIFGLTLLAVLGRCFSSIRTFHWQRLTDPFARLWLATGAKVAPQLLQAISLAWYGSHGMHLLTLVTVATMTIMRYILSHATVHRQETPHTISANKAAFRDLLAVCVMVAGWVIGRIALPHHLRVSSYHN